MRTSSDISLYPFQRRPKKRMGLGKGKTEEGITHPSGRRMAKRCKSDFIRFVGVEKAK